MNILLILTFACILLAAIVTAAKYKVKYQHSVAEFAYAKHALMSTNQSRIEGIVYINDEPEFSFHYCTNDARAGAINSPLIMELLQDNEAAFVEERAIRAKGKIGSISFRVNKVSIVDEQSKDIVIRRITLRKIVNK